VGKASPSSFSVTIASRVWRLLSKNAVNRGFLRFSKSMKCCQVLATKNVIIFCYKKACWEEWVLRMVGVKGEREFRFRGDLSSQESTFPLVYIYVLINNVIDFSSFKRFKMSLLSCNLSKCVHF